MPFTVPKPGWCVKEYIDHLCKLNLGNGTWPGGHHDNPRDYDDRAVRPIHISVPSDGGTTEDGTPIVEFPVYPVVGVALISNRSIRFPLRDELRNVGDEDPILFETDADLRVEAKERIQALLGD